MKRAGHMADIDSRLMKEYSHDIKAVALPGAAVAIDPGLCRFCQFAPFMVVHGLEWSAKIHPAAGFHLDEGNQAVKLGYDVDVSAAGAIAAMQDLPAASLEPADRDSFTKFAERVGSPCHTLKLDSSARHSVTVLQPSGSNSGDPKAGTADRRPERSSHFRVAHFLIDDLQ